MPQQAISLKPEFPYCLEQAGRYLIACLQTAGLDGVMVSGRSPFSASHIMERTFDIYPPWPNIIWSLLWMHRLSIDLLPLYSFCFFWGVFVMSQCFCITFEFFSLLFITIVVQFIVFLKYCLSCKTSSFVVNKIVLVR